ncbi:MAG TPA: DUF58 domain-containing protein [Luteimonas sp.]|nr:DUF58 domain-containing protein [Luteimonas sp.]
MRGDASATTGLIPADVRARLASLALTARVARGEHGFGQHSSRSRGSGMEFAQYRGYQPGDEPRHVDWKLYARSDRFFVREAERDSPLTVWILVDTTASMAQSDPPGSGPTRLHSARALAACLIEMALRQGDRFGLATFGGHGVQVHGAQAGPRQRDRCLLALQALVGGGGWPPEPAWQPLWERMGPRSLLLMLGDGFDEAGTRLAERFAAARREVACIRILTIGERDFPLQGGYRFRDPESGAELLGDAGAIREGFLQRFGAARVALHARLAAAGVRQVEYVLDEPLDAPLRRLFAPGTAAGAVAAGNP